MGDRMETAMSKVTDFLLDLVFPNRCPFCLKMISWDQLCCEECGSNLEKADFCPVCGMQHCVCGTALPRYDGCAVAAPYIGSVRKGVLQFKYHYGFNFAKLYAPRLARLVKEYGFADGSSVITAVPMTYARRNTTGYNQAEYIAKRLSSLLGIPCDFRLLKKLGKAVQHELGASQRKSAASASFSVERYHRDISGRTVILCDDIITTGSTLSGCAGILKSIGAKRVYCAVLCGTVLENKGESL